MIDIVFWFHEPAAAVMQPARSFMFEASVRLGQARPGQARPGQARPGQARPGQAGLG
jgi:hypothetical protein